MNKQGILKIIALKLLKGVSLILGISIFAFALLKVSPVDPVLASVNYDISMMTKEQYDSIYKPRKSSL